MLKAVDGYEHGGEWITHSINRKRAEAGGGVEMERSYPEVRLRFLFLPGNYCNL